jgi:hypothetical protein
MCWLAIALDGVEAEGATPETFKDKAREELSSLKYLTCCLLSEVIRV